MLTASQSPRVMAARMTEAVWNPPVQMTGHGDRLLDRARVRQVQPLDLVRPARRASSHCCLNTGP